jgi:deferrochelatase/peroxidase EfeB
LGLAASNPLAAQFSPAFSMGMANSARSHALGDVANDPSGEVADNSPEAWQWGGPLKPVVDAVLLIYAVNQEKLQTRFDAEKKRWEDAKMPPPQEIVLHRWPPSRDHKTRLPVPITEPFGFVDGISQPSIKGLLSARAALANDRLEPGEFILGYPDGRHQFSPTPQVFAYDDPGGLLPDLPPGFPLDPDGWSVRDLGRNGSYLVIRQLKQEIAKYRDYVNKAATQFPEWSWGAPDWVAAKMLGRWPNGAPLALFPDGPPGPDDYCPIAKDENFRFGRDDPQGLACPFGAHIRRANPRDQFDADDKTQMSITNRHRILRRGRAYVDGKDSGADAQGLLFMCLNADIERQFEFLQQGWVGSSSFGPLRREADPLTATNRKGGTYTIPTLAGPKQLTGMQSFVSVIGGGYFFLPGRRALEFLAT